MVTSRAISLSTPELVIAMNLRSASFSRMEIIIAPYNDVDAHKSADRCDTPYGFEMSMRTVWMQFVKDERFHKDRLLHLLHFLNFLSNKAEVLAPTRNDFDQDCDIDLSKLCLKARPVATIEHSQRPFVQQLIWNTGWFRLRFINFDLGIFNLLSGMQWDDFQFKCAEQHSSLCLLAFQVYSENQVMIESMIWNLWWNVCMADDIIVNEIATSIEYYSIELQLSVTIFWGLEHHSIHQTTCSSHRINILVSSRWKNMSQKIKHSSTW